MRTTRKPAVRVSPSESVASHTSSSWAHKQKTCTMGSMDQDTLATQACAAIASSEGGFEPVLGNAMKCKEIFQRQVRAAVAWAASGAFRPPAGEAYATIPCSGGRSGRGSFWANRRRGPGGKSVQRGPGRPPRPPECARGRPGREIPPETATKRSRQRTAGRGQEAPEAARARKWHR